MKDKFEILKKNFSVILVSFNILTILSLILSYVLKMNLFAITVGLFVTGNAIYFGFKDEVSDTQKDIGFKFFKTSFLIFTYSLIYSFCYEGIYKPLKMKALNPDPEFSMYAESLIRGANFSFIISILVNFIITIFIISYFRDKDHKKILESVKEKSLVDLFNKKKDSASDKVPDVVLCYDVDTGDPVILPHKDRYLHMLVLGPTGSGKTSQTIIPLINQDIQKNNIGITVLEPKGDLAEKICVMAQHYNKPVIYFNPILPNCPYFNPLFGKEDDVIENLATTFKMLNPDSPQFFLDMNENTLRNALKVLKRLDDAETEYEATFISLSRLLQNVNGEGLKMVNRLLKLPTTEELSKENQDIVAWFKNDYFSGASGERGGTKTYEHCSGLRSQVSKIISNKHLRKVLNPPRGKNDIDFDKHLREGGVISIATAQGDLRELGKYLGFFIILQFQSAVFRRPGREKTRMAHMLYIDEFQEFANPGFGIMLTQGRSYRVGCHLATQARAQIAMGRDGKSFLSLVSANARNLVVYPGVEAEDAAYYSRQFGEEKSRKDEKVITKKPFDPFNGSWTPGSDVTITSREKSSEKFSPSEIRFREFGEITYNIVQNNTLQPSGIGRIEWIPEELNDKLDDMIDEQFGDEASKNKNIEKTENSTEKKVETGIEIEYDVNIDDLRRKKFIENVVFEDDDLEFEFETNDDLDESLSDYNNYGDSAEIELPDDSLSSNDMNSIIIEEDDEDEDDLL